MKNYIKRWLGINFLEKRVKEQAKEISYLESKQVVIKLRLPGLGLDLVPNSRAPSRFVPEWIELDNFDDHEKYELPHAVEFCVGGEVLKRKVFK